MEKGRFTKVRNYLNKKFYTGKLVRWLIEDEDGSVYCDKCGNIANTIMQIKSGENKFNIPLCRVHFAEIMPHWTENCIPLIFNYPRHIYTKTYIHPINYK